VTPTPPPSPDSDPATEPAGLTADGPATGPEAVEEAGAEAPTTWGPPPGDDDRAFEAGVAGGPEPELTLPLDEGPPPTEPASPALEDGGPAGAAAGTDRPAWSSSSWGIEPAPAAEPGAGDVGSQVLGLDPGLSFGSGDWVVDAGFGSGITGVEAADESGGVEAGDNGIAPDALAKVTPDVPADSAAWSFETGPVLITQTAEAEAPDPVATLTLTPTLAPDAPWPDPPAAALEPLPTDDDAATEPDPDAEPLPALAPRPTAFGPRGGSLRGLLRRWTTPARSPAPATGATRSSASRPPGNVRRDRPARVPGPRRPPRRVRNAGRSRHPERMHRPRSPPYHRCRSAPSSRPR
jgi:hypothetical protein